MGYQRRVHGIDEGIPFQLKSVAFIDCYFAILSAYFPRIDSQQRKAPKLENIVNLLLPSQPNNLDVIKLEQSAFDKTNHKECKKAIGAFDSIERIKSSLCNLKGFVYAAPPEDLETICQYNLFAVLARNVLENLTSFKKIKSLHTHDHCDNDELFSYLDKENIPNLSNIDELCVTIPETDWYRLKTFAHLAHLKKLCLVIDVSSLNDAFCGIIKQIICNSKLQLFQIVILVNHEDDDDDDAQKCEKDMKTVELFISELSKTLQSITPRSSPHALVFKLHIKICHENHMIDCTLEDYDDDDCDEQIQFLKTIGNSMQSLFVNYLATFPVGHMQIKLSWDTQTEIKHMRKLLRPPLERLNAIFDVETDASGCLFHLYDESEKFRANGFNRDKDFYQYAISAQNKNLPNDTTYDKHWSVDCRYCCNTPWIHADK